MEKIFRHAILWNGHQLEKSIINLRLAHEKHDYNGVEKALDEIISNAMHMGAAVGRLKELQKRGGVLDEIL
jgi:hypothetical protein